MKLLSSSSISNETDIDDTISLLKAWRDKDVKAEVDKRFKENGYTPKQSATQNSGANPWMKEQWNITEQMRIESTNPEEAAKLMAAAGVR